MKRISIVRGSNLNQFEMQNYEPLTNEFDLTGYTIKGSQYSTEDLAFAVKELYGIETFTSKFPQITRKPIEIYQNRYGYVQYMLHLERAIARSQIVHTAEIHNSYTFQAAKAAERDQSLKHVCTVWRNIPFTKWRLPFLGYIPRTTHQKREVVINNVDLFLPVTDRSKEALIAEGVPEDKIEVVHPGVDLTKFKPRDEPTEVEGLHDKSDLRFLFVGRFVWEKGIMTLLRSFKKLLSDDELPNNVTLTLIGSGPEHNEIKSRVHQLGLTEHCHIIQSVPYSEIHTYYNSSDVFLLPSTVRPSWQEQYGMVLIEAMASGLPIITTTSGSIPDVVGDAAELIPPSDFLSLYESMKKLAFNRGRRERLSQMARERAVERYDRMKTAERIKGIYMNL